MILSASLLRARTPRTLASTWLVRSICKVAIVGSGPSGCYTAKYLQSALDKKGQDSQIDIIERLPTPYGLVRFGVAPDHPEVKNVQNDFDLLFEDKGVDFYGNVQVGTDVSVQELRDLYNVVVLAYGCESDRKMGVQGEELPGVLSAREFVAWYNGHPDFAHIGEQVKKALGGSDEPSVVVVGQGNVALDCARILSKGKQGLENTDIASRALSLIGQGVPNVTIVGRRGHIQGAFTIKEVRELVKLKSEGMDASFVVRPDELEMGATEASLEELTANRPRQRIDKLLREASQVGTLKMQTDGDKSC
jgi:adrenodoxin-NADP+ reductase